MISFASNNYVKEKALSAAINYANKNISKVECMHIKYK